MDDFKLSILDEELFKRRSKITTLDLVKYMNYMRKSDIQMENRKFYNLLVSELNKKSQNRMDHLREIVLIFRVAYGIDTGKDYVDEV